MVKTLVSKMFGGKEPGNANPKAKKFVDFVTKKNTPPPDIMSADFKPFICKYSPNDGSSKPKIMMCDPEQPFAEPCPKIVDQMAMARTYKCDGTKDCAHYWDYKLKGLSCASKSSGKRCSRASECESWMCVDDPLDVQKKCITKAIETGGECLTDETDLECGDCKAGVCAPAYQKCPDVKDRKYDLVCYMPNWAQYRHPNQNSAAGRRPNWRGFLVPERIDPCVCTHYLYAFARIGVPKRHPSSYSQDPDPSQFHWMPAHSEMTDLSIHEYENIPGGCVRKIDGCEVPKGQPSSVCKESAVCGSADDVSWREAWFNEGGWNQMNRFNRHIKKLNPHAKTMISLGGWDNEFTQAIGLIAREVNGCDKVVPNRTNFPWVADSYPPMLSDFDRIKIVDCSTNPVAPNRADFIKGLYVFACKYGFDGVDIDWEYPAKTGWVGSSETWIGSPYDRDALSVLMKETRDYFDNNACPSEIDLDETSETWKLVKPVNIPLSSGGSLHLQTSPFSRGRKLMVSSATSPAIKRVQAGYDAKSIGRDEDYIGIMSYDFHGAWDEVTGPQAPLFNKERVNGFASPLTDKVFPENPSQVDDFTIIRGNEVWNDPFNKKANTAFPRKSVGVPHQKIYTGFSTYGRGWTLPSPITSSSDPAFKYGTASLCYRWNAQPPNPNAPACCPGCNGNGARDVTKERGISTLYDLEESQAGLWNADTAYRKYDEGTVTAYAASGDQFISYDTWETLALKAVWMRDVWLKGANRMPGNGRFGGAIVWSIDTDDFNNAMPHHWVIACYLESNYYLSQHPMCQCRFWKTWAAKNLPGAPADVDSKFQVCNEEPCDADDPMGTRRRLHGDKRARRTTSSGSEYSGASDYIHHDSHTRAEQNIEASRLIQQLRIEKHEKEVHHYREHHLQRRRKLHAKHGRHLDTDRRHLNADSVTAPVHECSLDVTDVTVFEPPPFTDNCASDVTLPNTCPAVTGNTPIKPPTNVLNETTGEIIGTLPSQIQIMSADVPIGDNNCMMKYNRTWYFLDACYNMAQSYQIYYKQDLTPPPLNDFEAHATVEYGTGEHEGLTQTRTTYTLKPAHSTCTEYINGKLNRKVENGTIGCPAAEIHLQCGQAIPPGPNVNVSLDACINAGGLPSMTHLDGESQCVNAYSPAIAPCPRLFSRSWETSDECNNTRKIEQKVYVCASPPCDKEAPGLVSCDGTSGGVSGATGIATVASGGSCISIADAACPDRVNLGSETDLDNIIKRLEGGGSCNEGNLAVGDKICYACGGSFDLTECRPSDANALCSTLTTTSTPKLEDVCTGDTFNSGQAGYFSGLLKSGTIECAGKACTSSDAETCCIKEAYKLCNTMPKEIIKGLCKKSETGRFSQHGDIFTGGLYCTPGNACYCAGNTCGIWDGGHWAEDAQRCCERNENKYGIATCSSLNSKSTTTSISQNDLCRNGRSVTGKEITINYSGELKENPSTLHCQWNVCGITAFADIDRVTCCAIIVTPCTDGLNGMQCQNGGDPIGDSSTVCGCSCQSSHTGPNCEFEKCTKGFDGNACLNGSPSGHTGSTCGCSCLEGWNGNNCETPERGVEVIQSSGCWNKAEALCPGQGSNYDEIFIKNDVNAIHGCSTLKDSGVSNCWNCNAPTNPTTADSFGNIPGCDFKGTSAARCSTLTSNSVPSLATVCTGTSYTGDLKSGINYCAGNVCGTGDKINCCHQDKATCSTLTGSTLASVCAGASYSGLIADASTTYCAADVCSTSDAPTCCAEVPCTASCPYKCRAAAHPPGGSTDATCKECKNNAAAWPCNNPKNCVCRDPIPKAKCSSLTTSSTPTLADVCAGQSYTGELLGTGAGECADEICTYSDASTCCVEKVCDATCAYKCGVATDQRSSGGVEPQGGVHDGIGHGGCLECKSTLNEWPCDTLSCICKPARPCTSDCSGSCGAAPYQYPHPAATCDQNPDDVSNSACNLCKANNGYPCNKPGCCVCWG